jgi:hypothetical protein
MMLLQSLLHLNNWPPRNQHMHLEMDAQNSELKLQNYDRKNIVLLLQAISGIIVFMLNKDSLEQHHVTRENKNHNSIMF